MQVTQLWRYPVKSVGGERVDEIDVGPLGFALDRQWGLVDGDTGLVLTARRAPDLLHADAMLTDGEVALRLPDGTVTADDEVLSDWLGRRVTLRRPSDGERGTYEISTNDDNPDAEWMQWTGPEGVFHDSGRTRVSIVSQDAIGDWDVRRFRANVVVDAGDERSLVGHDVHAGDVGLQVVKEIDRCVIVTRPQPGIERDKSVLVDIHRTRGGNLGVGAVVTRPGVLRVGDHLEREL